MIIDTSKIGGVTRPIDNLGRFCIPREFRTALNITSGDLLETILLADGALLIVPTGKKFRSSEGGAEK
ncbi:MAG: AbrB/MazE/SpoVT family DNA-binding domain-containing protein [Oscillospiraceae bacterium]|jgi:bifunctional DNA-binding transcriptional regulator/antitoxin component of YhaV-PrlF toxin-antitoxin module|nr:AbrB/MazE/SpoVT family DNA-binding domain-containing protein [Oscillospiraceae bacterium]